jgi:hypothetical protein
VAEGDVIVEQNEAPVEETAAPVVNEYQAKYERLADLERYVDAVGGTEALISLAQAGHRFNTDPQIRAAIEAGISAQTPTEPEEEIYDPEVKALKGRYDPIINELRQQNASLQDRLNKSEVNSLKTVLTSNVEAALSTFKDDPDLLKQATAEIERAVSHAENLAKSGDRNAISQLEQLSGPGGSKTLKMMTIDLYEKLVEKKLSGVNNVKPDATASLQSKATDARHTTRAALPADTVAIRPGAKVTSNLTREVLEKVTEKMTGKSASQIWG